MNQKQIIKAYEKFMICLKSHEFKTCAGTETEYVYISKRKNQYSLLRKHIYIDVSLNQIANKNYFIYIINTIAHEVGHYLAAPPQRRKKVDFGIPVERWESRQKRHERKYDIEEVKACLIQQKIVNMLGFKIRINSQLTELLTNKEQKLVRTWWKSDGKKMVEEFMSVK